MALPVANFLLLNTGITSAVTAAAVAGAIVSTATSLAISTAVSALNKPKFDPVSQAAGLKGNSRVSDGAKQFVYGHRLLGGNIVFEATTGEVNKFYHLVIALAAHEIQAIGDIYFDDKIANINDFGEDQQSVYDVTISGSYAEDDVVDIIVNMFAVASVTVDNTFTANDVAAALKSDFDIAGSVLITMSVVDNTLTITTKKPGDTVDIAVNVNTSGFTGSVVQTQAERRELYRVKKYLGSQGQVADADLMAEVPEWKSTMIGEGQAYIYVRLEYSREIYKVFPIIRADVLGKKIYDPRSNQTVYSNNSALVHRDFLTADYGGQVLDEDIDDASYIVAANICDEQVSISDTLTESRYTCNAAGTMGAQWSDIETYISETAGGFATKTNGYYRFDPAYIKPLALSQSLTDEDLREGTVDVDNGGGPENIINGIKGTFVSPDDFYAATDYPQLNNDQYIDDDNGYERTIEQNYPYTTSHTTAQRLSKMALLRARANKTVTLRLNMIGHFLKVGDVVKINIERAKINNKKYKVVKWDQATNGADVILILDDDASYQWHYTEAKPYNSEFLPYLGSAFSFTDEVNNVVEIP